jgi:transcriptional regulator with XRE-family HTH domain
MSLGARVRAVRQAWGWTQEQFGKALNTDQTAVSAWERDKVKPSGAAMAALAQLLGVPVEDLESMEKIPESPVISGCLPVAGAMVYLPEPAPSGLTVLDLKHQETRPLEDTQAAILTLIEWGRKGRRVWLVVE